MKKIVAIGGGEIGRPGYSVETTKIDREIIRLTGKKKPKILFIPTASLDSESYYETFIKHFENRLKCRTDVLYLIKEKLSTKEIEKKVFSADAVYVGGGNTQKMLNVWKKTGLDKILEKAWKKGIVLSGLSAGSICWFQGGISDSKKMIDPKADLIKIKALGFIQAIHSPHFDKEKDRRPGLKRIMKNTKGIAIALDNCAALEVVNDTYRIIASRPRAKAYKVYWKDGRYYEEIIPKEKDFLPLEDILG